MLSTSSLSWRWPYPRYHSLCSWGASLWSPWITRLPWAWWPLRGDGQSVSWFLELCSARLQSHGTIWVRIASIRWALFWKWSIAISFPERWNRNLIILIVRFYTENMERLLQHRGYSHWCRNIDLHHGHYCSNSYKAVYEDRTCCCFWHASIVSTTSDRSKADFLNC